LKVLLLIGSGGFFLIPGLSPVVRISESFNRNESSLLVTGVIIGISSIVYPYVLGSIMVVKSAC
jgi:hypothetical protein